MITMSTPMTIAESWLGELRKLTIQPAIATHDMAARNPLVLCFASQVLSACRRLISFCSFIVSNNETTIAENETLCNYTTCTRKRSIIDVTRCKQNKYNGSDAV